jgi:UDP-3-O-[3-hydroxymyristoyl] N-acetylglucosamine deacetylase
MRQQRTLRHVIGCAGVGLHSGARVAVTLRPAAEGSGIRFRRVDRPGSPPIAARPHNATAVAGSTGLASSAGAAVRRVGHLLAALVACEVDNVLVEVSGPELPAMDGSARPFALLVECAGTVEQTRPVPRFEVLRPVEARSGSGWALMQPADALELVVEPAADREGVPALRLTVSPEACKGDLIGARDRACRSGAPERPGASTAETIRHAALEALGSLALIPARIAGRYLERNADAALRCALLRKLLEDRRNWRLSGPASDRDGLLAAAPLAWAS